VVWRTAQGQCFPSPRGWATLRVGDLDEATYRRTDLFERRRTLMEQWAVFLSGTEGPGRRTTG